MAHVGSVALLLILLRYISIRLISSDQHNIKEVSLVKILTSRTRVLLSSTLETIWAAGVGNVVGPVISALPQRPPLADNDGLA